MNQPVPESAIACSLPVALVRAKSSGRPTTHLWWITLVAIVAAIVLVVLSLRARGPTVTIRFAEGHGLKAGDALKYRGIDIGEVTGVVLAPDHHGVLVRVLLEAQAKQFARHGSLFWIERPQVSLARVSGLETVVGAKHLGVIPAAADEPPAVDFEGLESPPTLARNEAAQATEITIRFREGQGLHVGDPLRHRGIAVGEVTAVDLTGDLAAVTVRVRLVGEAQRLACEGTQFWVERPRVSLAEVRGLETLVGGRYVAVLPGPPDAKPQSDFEGMDAFTPTEIPPGALELVLHAPQRWGVDRGVAVTYRGVRVGQVLSVGLAADGTRIEARAFVEARYRSLVRENSEFWSNGGVDVSLGLTGLQVSAETLSSIAQGGVAFATPPEPGRPASTGRQFAYHKSPRDEWLTWQPRIAAEVSLPDHVALPQPDRAVVHWGERSFGIRRNRERTGWILRLDNGQWLGPADLFQPALASKSAVTVESGGQEQTLTSEQCRDLGQLVLFRPLDQPENLTGPWPVQRIRVATVPEDSLIVTDAAHPSVPITASSLRSAGGLWEIAGTNGLTPELHGAAVVAIKDGQLIGQLKFQSGKASIAIFEQIPE